MFRNNDAKNAFGHATETSNAERPVYLMGNKAFGRNYRHNGLGHSDVPNTARTYTAAYS